LAIPRGIQLGIPNNLLLCGRRLFLAYLLGPKLHSKGFKKKEKKKKKERKKEKDRILSMTIL